MLLFVYKSFCHIMGLKLLLAPVPVDSEAVLLLTLLVAEKLLVFRLEPMADCWLSCCFAAGCF
jgi:hypothetical protein